MEKSGLMLNSAVLCLYKQVEIYKRTNVWTVLESCDSNQEGLHVIVQFVRDNNKMAFKIHFKSILIRLIMPSPLHYIMKKKIARERDEMLPPGML